MWNDTQIKATWCHYIKKILGVTGPTTTWERTENHLYMQRKVQIGNKSNNEYTKVYGKIINIISKTISSTLSKISLSLCLSVSRSLSLFWIWCSYNVLCTSISPFSFCSTEFKFLKNYSFWVFFKLHLKYNLRIIK